MSKVIHNPRNTRIFVSYSKDNDFVKRFVNDLCYVLDDKDAADVDWWLEITRQITARKVFVLILSPDALKSPWVPEEILMAYRGEKSKTSTKKKFIVIHFRECKHEIPNTLNFLHDRQWIQCSTLKTYQAVLYELLKTLNIPINARITNYIRTLDLWDLEAFVRPKANADFSEKEREEYLNVLGKYNVVYIQQDRWDEV